MAPSILDLCSHVRLPATPSSQHPLTILSPCRLVVQAGFHHQRAQHQQRCQQALARRGAATGHQQRVHHERIRIHRCVGKGTNRTRVLQGAATTTSPAPAAAHSPSTTPARHRHCSCQHREAGVQTSPLSAFHGPCNPLLLCLTLPPVCVWCVCVLTLHCRTQVVAARSYAWRCPLMVATCGGRRRSHATRHQHLQVSSRGHTHAHTHTHAQPDERH